MTRPLGTIVAATSLTESSDFVVRAGAEMARRSGTALHLFHAYAVPVAYFATPAVFTSFDPQIFESEQEMREQLLMDQLRRVGLGREEVTSVAMVAGTPHRTLIDTARELHAALIVVGASEAVGPLSLGSTADRVLRKATLPVLVVRGDLRWPAEHILAPVDLSAHSEASLRRGLGIVDVLERTLRPRIDALFVLAPDELGASTQFTAEQIDRLAHAELDRFIARFDPDNARGIRASVRTGDPRQEILRDLEEHRSDLVVLGTHGRGGFERFLLGSVASDVAGRAPCSALVIPPETKEEGAGGSD